MKTLKKTLCLVLAVVMAVGVLVIPANAATEFTDDADITHDEAVAVLSGLGIVNGVGDGSFNPDGTFTRAQAAALLANVVLTPDYAAILDSDKAVFSDVPVTNGYNKYITWAVENDYIHGYTDGTFKPNKELTGTELAALMLEVLGEELDAANYKNFVNTTAKKYKLTDGITGYVASSVISRDDAVQMMFNTMNYSKAGTVYQVVGSTGTNYGTYPSYSEAYTIVVLLAAAQKDAEVKPIDDPSASILSSVYEASNNSSKLDGFKRPSNVWTDKTGATLYSEPQKAVLEYDGPVTYKKIYADLGATRETKAKLYIDGLARDDTYNVASTAADHELSTAKKADVAVGLADKNGYGIETYVYEAGRDSNDVMTYTIVQMLPYYAKVTKVADVEKDHSGVKEKTATFDPVDGQYTDKLGNFTSTKYIDFAKDDMVIFNGFDGSDEGDTLDTTSVSNAYKLDTVTGTLSRIVTKNGVPVYTIGGNEYHRAWVSTDTKTNAKEDVDDLSKSIGSEITVRVDKFNNIVDVVEAAATDPNYILVLNAQEPTGTGWTVSGGTSTGLVYGILSDGTYGTYTVNYSNTSDSGYLTTKPNLGSVSSSTYAPIVYQYNTNADGELLLFVNSAKCGNVTETITNGSTKATFTNNAASPASKQPAVLNSETLFVYYTAENGAVKTFATRVGNAYCGSITINETNKAYVGLKNNGAAKVVFVNKDYNAAINTSGYVYIKDTSVNMTKEMVNNQISTVYHYTGIKSDGTTIDVWTISASMVDSTTGKGLYQINTDNSISQKMEAKRIGTTDYAVVHGKVIEKYVDTLGVDETDPFGSTPENYRAYTDDIYTFCGDSTEIKGNEYWAVVKYAADNNGAFTAIWFIS